MELKKANLNCQIPCLPIISEGRAKTPPQSLVSNARLFVRRHLTPNQNRAIKKFINQLIDRFQIFPRKSTRRLVNVDALISQPLEAGDWVRVRSLDEIQVTLNNWLQLKGCTFLPEMVAYCGSLQRVLKPVRRFVDERDLMVKKASGVILLEGVMCQGVSNFGSCDRSCHYFWRQEWLEKIDGTKEELISGM
jgi:hypothetical protein